MTKEQSDAAALVERLRSCCSKLVQGCQQTAEDGTVFFTRSTDEDPPVLSTRDFAAMLESGSPLVPTELAEPAVRVLLNSVRKPGTAPDRVRLNGKPLYASGPDLDPFGEPNLDNASFLAIMVDGLLKRVPEEDRADELFAGWSPVLDLVLQNVPRSALGLAYNNPYRPHCPFGAAAAAAKTGNLFMESLLLWTAFLRMARWHDRLGNGQAVERYLREAATIQENIDTLWDPSRGLFLAASTDCSQPDVWGNAFALYLGFPLGERREAIFQYFWNRYDQYAWRAHIRPLPVGEYWSELLFPVPREREENGAFWALPSGWVLWILSQDDERRSLQMLREIVREFEEHGVHRCINRRYRSGRGHVASALNLLSAAERVFQSAIAEAARERAAAKAQAAKERAAARARAARERAAAKSGEGLPVRNSDSSAASPVPAKSKPRSRSASESTEQPIPSRERAGSAAKSDARPGRSKLPSKPQRTAGEGKPRAQTSPHPAVRKPKTGRVERSKRDLVKPASERSPIRSERPSRRRAERTTESAGKSQSARPEEAPPEEKRAKPVHRPAKAARRDDGGAERISRKNGGGRSPSRTPENKRVGASPTAGRQRSIAAPAPAESTHRGRNPQSDSVAARTIDADTDQLTGKNSARERDP